MNIMFQFHHYTSTLVPLIVQLIISLITSLENLPIQIWWYGRNSATFFNLIKQSLHSLGIIFHFFFEFQQKKKIVQLVLCIELGIFQNFQFILKLAREFETYVNKYHSSIEHCFKYTLFYVVFTNTFFSSVIPIWLCCVSSWFLFDSSYVLFFIQQISLIRKMMVAGIECFFSSFLIYIVCFKYLIITKKKVNNSLRSIFSHLSKRFFFFSLQ